MIFFLFFVFGILYGESIDDSTEVREQIECQYIVIALENIDVYVRPGFESELFGILVKGDSIVLSGRDDQGWLGFDPGVAQAGNIGVFRLRWIGNNSAVSVIGDINELPVLNTPKPGICYNMFFCSTDVYTEPDSNSEVLFTLEEGDFAEVIERNEDRWILIKLDEENPKYNGKGWISPEDINLNGPCDDL